jgi:hypothetical protein
MAHTRRQYGVLTSLLWPIHYCLTWLDAPLPEIILTIKEHVTNGIIVLYIPSTVTVTPLLALRALDPPLSILILGKWSTTKYALNIIIIMVIGGIKNWIFRFRIWAARQDPLWSVFCFAKWLYSSRLLVWFWSLLTLGNDECSLQQLTCFLPPLDSLWWSSIWYPSACFCTVNRWHELLFYRMIVLIVSHVSGNVGDGLLCDGWRNVDDDGVDLCLSASHVEDNPSAVVVSASWIMNTCSLNTTPFLGETPVSLNLSQLFR